MKGECVEFGRWRLHRTQGLVHGAHEVRVTPKSLAVLWCLATRAGEVVSKDDMFRAVWPRCVVSDAALASCIRELRSALEDDARRPRFIETLHRRGFRFIAPVGDSAMAGSIDPGAGVMAGEPKGMLVGRELALQRLRHALTQVRAGSRYILFVTGEPGIGKTALLEAFLAEVGGAAQERVARADCVERYGAGEAYQPLLEILTRLCRTRDGERFLEVLRRCAPTWLAQLPALVAPAELLELQRRTTGVTPERMLRELTDAVEEMSATAPLILCVEDLHWSDAATLDWIASFARRRERAGVLLLVTQRPGQTRMTVRSAQGILDDLRVRGLCAQIELTRLAESHVAGYVRARFAPMSGGPEASARLATLVHRRTDGNPLFVVNVLADLMSRGVLEAGRDGWSVSEDLDAAALAVPNDVRNAIEQQLGRLSAAERELLEVASLLGGSCAAAAIAAAAEQTPGATEAALDSIAARRALIRRGCTLEWPDGTVTPTFEFLHALYREVLADGLTPTRRAGLHRHLAMRLEAGYAARAPEIAAELAVHFDEARDPVRAITYYQHAAETERGRSAHDSARRHYERALALLDKLPADAARDEREAALRLGIGNVMMQLRGWGAAEVEAAYLRARELCRRRGLQRQEFAALWNLWIYDTGRGLPGKARRRAEELLELAKTANDPPTMLQAHHAFWTTLFQVGDLQGALRHARDGLAICSVNPACSHTLTYGSHDTSVCALVFQARALLLCDESQEATRVCEEAVVRARALDHPFTLAFALMHAATIDQERLDIERARDNALAAVDIARDHGFSLLHAWSGTFLGWAKARLGAAGEGIALMRASISAARETRSEMFQSHLLCLLAETQLAAGMTSECVQTVEEGLAFGVRSGECTYVAELHRVRGEAHGARAALAAAERDFGIALQTARSQGARLFEARARHSLAALRTQARVEPAAARVK